MVSTFLAEGPRMIDFFRRETALDFVAGATIPDFHDRSPGAGFGHRSVSAAPYDARALGPRLADLEPPLDLVAPFGMGIASGADLRHFFDVRRKLGSFLHVAKRVARHAADLLRHGRGMTLVGGNALVARLLESADDRGVRFLTATAARAPLLEGGRVVGLVVEGPTGRRLLRARRGVVLAAGGFPHDTARKARLFPHAPTGREHHSAAPEANTGDGLSIGESAGGWVRDDLLHAGAWAPVSLVPRRDGTIGRFPHLIERGKPGLIMVTRDGRRFADEADSYHDVMSALFAATPPGEPVRAWMICDARFLARYGLGRVRPFPFPRRPWLRNGYLKRGRDLAALAAACGIDPTGLTATVERFNGPARRGDDPEFHRGMSAYNRLQGEPDHAPNPCVAPIERAPYYAVEILPGSLGTFAGLATDAHARVLDRADRPIPGLWAVGNDMSSLMAGRYPAGGITLGPAMTFGFVAAQDAAGAYVAARDAAGGPPKEFAAAPSSPAHPPE
jgi:succinate dehydrogenase/fumarate reductase flavoprotein subunit